MDTLLGKSTLRYWRRERGLTQVQLAKRLDVHPLFISIWENNRSLPTKAQMEELSRILDIAITQLF
jgi:transcriptional regulator with XRE-family HTH domain